MTIKDDQILDQLKSIEQRLINIEAKLTSKINLYCPGCKTLNEILHDFRTTMESIRLVKQDCKLSDILSKVESIEKVVLESRADELRRRYDEAWK